MFEIIFSNNAFHYTYDIFLEYWKNRGLTAIALNRLKKRSIFNLETKIYRFILDYILYINVFDI